MDPIKSVTRFDAASDILAGVTFVIVPMAVALFFPSSPLMWGALFLIPLLGLSVIDRAVTIFRQGSDIKRRLAAEGRASAISPMTYEASIAAKTSLDLVSNVIRSGLILALSIGLVVFATRVGQFETTNAIGLIPSLLAFPVHFFLIRPFVYPRYAAFIQGLNKAPLPRVQTTVDADGKALIVDFFYRTQVINGSLPEPVRLSFSDIKDMRDLNAAEAQAMAIEVSALSQLQTGAALFEYASKRITKPKTYVELGKDVPAQHFLFIKGNGFIYMFPAADERINSAVSAWEQAMRIDVEPKT